MSSFAEIRLVPCQVCGSEGRLFSGHPNDPNPKDEGPCLACEGTGNEIVDVLPIEEDDLERCVVCGVTPFFYPCNERACPFRARHKTAPGRDGIAAWRAKKIGG